MGTRRSLLSGYDESRLLKPGFRSVLTLPRYFDVASCFTAAKNCKQIQLACEGSGEQDYPPPPPTPQPVSVLFFVGM